ncbi:hypothetical protein B0J12DRAFT_677881 [Macrophomina phaseolina]|uniref:Uncharacterized protein n=1 Tax=Macrophomina phaseolina TaxID=35725 RepID=A0ABQ8FZZ1_9PEZI|nr:hypothetical protein B0J12DRAFT_677881 [Macrophomina phaseolina]
MVWPDGHAGVGLVWAENGQRDEMAVTGSSFGLETASSSTASLSPAWSAESEEDVDTPFQHLGTAEEACLPPAVDFIRRPRVLSKGRKRGLVRENWGTNGTPVQIFVDGTDELGEKRNRGLSDYIGPELGLPVCSGVLTQFCGTGFSEVRESSEQTVVEKARKNRPRRLNIEPTPHRVAARDSKKYFRKPNRKAGSASPTVRTIAASELPLSDGFQIDLREEEEQDPFMGADQAGKGNSLQMATQTAQATSSFSMEKIDTALERLWNLYANGNAHSRHRLLQDLQVAINLQEMATRNSRFEH